MPVYSRTAHRSVSTRTWSRFSQKNKQPVCHELANKWYSDHFYKCDFNAIQVIWLMIMLAYNILHIFLFCNIKIGITAKGLANMFTTTNGTKTQYYHRYSMGMLISAEGICIPLDIEMQKGGEDEVACAVRLVERLCQMYPRAFDVVMADGLYARAPFFKKIASLNKEVIGVLKDERRELIKEARKRCEGMTAEAFARSNGAVVTAWDLENCQYWTQLDMPVRVVRTLETTAVCRQDTGIIEKSTTEWLWVTTISKKHLNTEQFVEVAHHRWDIENKGFNELATFWHLNHVYKHDANAIVAFTLMTMLSYTLFHAFLYLNVKAIAREGKTKRHFQRLIMASFYAYLEKER